MTLFEYILKKDQINFKYLFQVLKKKIFTIIITTSVIFTASSLYAYKKMSKQIDVKIFFDVSSNINILKDEYRRAVFNNDRLRNFMDDFIKDFFDAYYNTLDANSNKNYTIMDKKVYDKPSYFHFSLVLNSLKIFRLDHLSLIQNDFTSFFDETLYLEAKRYSSAIDINFKDLKKSINLKNVEVLKFDKMKFILILISTFLTSLIISVLFIFFTKIK